MTTITFDKVAEAQKLCARLEEIGWIVPAGDYVFPEVDAVNVILTDKGKEKMTILKTLLAEIPGDKLTYGQVLNFFHILYTQK